MSPSAREEILGRIRQAVGAGDARERGAGYGSIDRNYEAAGTLEPEARSDLFVEHLKDYGAGVHRCREDAIAGTVAACLEARNRRTIVVPPAVAESWLPAGFEYVRDEMLPYEQLDRSDGAITGCTVAVATTGSLILQHAGGLGRRALSLIPDYHLCVVYEHQVVETIPEAFQVLERDGVSSATIVSGPSATSDIEMTRVQGVHGPRTLDVILVSTEG